MGKRRAVASEYVIFELGRWRYAIGLADVVEVVRAVTIVPLPKAPAVIEGLINLRGSLVPVLDIRLRFGLPAKLLDVADHLLIITTEARLMAFRVDRVVELLSIREDVIEDACRTVPAAQYLAGVAKLPDGLVLIHDLATFLSRTEAAELAAITFEEAM